MPPDQPPRHRGLSATFEGVSFVLVFDTGLTELLNHVMRSCARDQKSIWTDEDKKKELNTEKWKWQDTERSRTWTCSTDNKRANTDGRHVRKTEGGLCDFSSLPFSNYARVAVMCFSSPLHNLCANMLLPVWFFWRRFSISFSFSISFTSRPLHLFTSSPLLCSIFASPFFCSISALPHCFQPQNLVRT